MSSRFNPEALMKDLRPLFPHWEKVKDMTDQCIDIMLNLRQSGHPGGSRSKVHMLVALFLSGAMRWDIRNPQKRFADRFILSAGHVVPVIYALLAVLNEALRQRYAATGDARYWHAQDEKALVWEDLLSLRHAGGLPGHAEMAGKTNIFKANTGPSGHGMPVSVGQAMALKYAGSDDIRVFAIEGEGGLTAGVTHESLNSAYGLGLNNLYFLLDWNDYGIDNRPFSSVVYGTPEDWFNSHGWNVFGAEQGSEWGSASTALINMTESDQMNDAPSVAWFRTRKGRGYGVYDNKSHGAAHKYNSELFWATKKEFADKYDLSFDGFGESGPESREDKLAQASEQLKKVMSLYEQDPALLEYVSDQLVKLGDDVPADNAKVFFDIEKNPLNDPVITDYENYPEDIFAAPGSVAPNRAGLAKFAAWVNSYSQDKYGRPVYLAMSADLADSTNISGFGKGYGDQDGLGFYERKDNPRGVMLPQGITEFANAGICTGISAVNFSANNKEEFNGFYSACSTYGSFSYLKYGAMRLYSQMAQDAEIKLGKVLWIAGHSGPETAEDSRTHFGIYSPAVTQLFPDGHVINLYPWEHNEVAPMLGAAMATDKAIIALHLTRPGIEIPDREALGMASHLDAAKGAYIIRNYKTGAEKQGVIFIQGTSTTANLVKILPELDARGINVKIVAAVSPQLFALQSEEYRQSIISPDEWRDSTFITNGGRRTMLDWTGNRESLNYAICSDFDDEWRTGGSADEICEEAHISPEWILDGIEKFANERAERLSRLGLVG